MQQSDYDEILKKIIQGLNNLTKFSNELDTKQNEYLERIAEIEQQVEAFQQTEISEDLQNKLSELETKVALLEAKQTIREYEQSAQLQQGVPIMPQTQAAQPASVQPENPQPNAQPSDAQQEPNEPTFFSKFINAFFNVVIIGLIVIVGLSVQQGSNFSLAGYRLYSVLSGSMRPEIPTGSLVISKTTDPNTLRVGDDITFYESETKIVTHRIQKINYDSQSKTFITKGVANPNPDENPVYPANILGKVVYHVPQVGYVLSYISDRIIVVIILIIISSIALSYLKRVLVEYGQEKSARQVFGQLKEFLQSLFKKRKKKNTDEQNLAETNQNLDNIEKNPSNE